MFNNQEFEIEMFRDAQSGWCVILWRYDDIEIKHTDLDEEEAEALFIKYSRKYQTARKVKYES